MIATILIVLLALLVGVVLLCRYTTSSSPLVLRWLRGQLWFIDVGRWENWIVMWRWKGERWGRFRQHVPRKPDFRRWGGYVLGLEIGDRGGTRRGVRHRLRLDPCPSAPSAWGCNTCGTPPIAGYTASPKQRFRASFLCFAQRAVGRVFDAGALEWGRATDQLCTRLQENFEDWLVAQDIDASDTLPGYRARVERRWASHGVERPRRAAVLTPNTVATVFTGVEELIVMACFPAWVWLHHPAFVFGCTAGDARTVDRDSARHRDLIDSGWYRQTFDIDWKVRDDRDTKEMWVTTAGGVRLSRSMRARWTGVHVDAILMCDPALGVEQVEAWEQGIQHRVNDLGCSLRVVLYDRWCGLVSRMLSGGPWDPRDASGRQRWCGIGDAAAPAAQDDVVTVSRAGQVVAVGRGWTAPDYEGGEMKLAADLADAKPICKLRINGGNGNPANAHRECACLRPGDCKLGGRGVGPAGPEQDAITERFERS